MLLLVGVLVAGLIFTGSMTYAMSREQFVSSRIYRYAECRNGHTFIDGRERSLPGRLTVSHENCVKCGTEHRIVRNRNDKLLDERFYTIP